MVSGELAQPQPPELPPAPSGARERRRHLQKEREVIALGRWLIVCGFVLLAVAAMCYLSEPNLHLVGAMLGLLGGLPSMVLGVGILRLEPWAILPAQILLLMLFLLLLVTFLPLAILPAFGFFRLLDRDSRYIFSEEYARIRSQTDAALSPEAIREYKRQLKAARQQRRLKKHLRKTVPAPTD